MTLPRKTPRATSPSPISSGCWCPRCLRDLPLRFLIRAGVFGRSLAGRFLAATRTVSRCGWPFPALRKDQMDGVVGNVAVRLANGDDAASCSFIRAGASEDRDPSDRLV